MKRFISKIRSFCMAEDGATATEYAVMIALIVLVCIGAVAALGVKVSDVFAETESTWNSL